MRTQPPEPKEVRQVVVELLGEAATSARCVRHNPTRAKLLRRIERTRRRCGLPLSTPQQGEPR